MAEERVAMKISEALEPGGGDAAAGGPPDGAPWRRPDEGVPSSRRSAARLRRARRARACWMAGLRRGIAMDRLDAEALRVGRDEAHRRARTSGGTSTQHRQCDDNRTKLVDVHRRVAEQGGRMKDARVLQEELRAVLASRGAIQKVRATTSQVLERQQKELEATAREASISGRQRTQHEAARGMPQAKQRAEQVREPALLIEDMLEEFAGFVAAAALGAKRLAEEPGPRSAEAESARAGTARTFTGDTETGAQDPLGFLDPIHFGTDSGARKDLRAGEIVHGHRAQVRASAQVITDAGLQPHGVFGFHACAVPGCAIDWACAASVSEACGVD